MAERPSERDLMLDAIDDAFKSEVTQFAKNAGTACEEVGAEHDRQMAAVRDGIALTKRARLLMISLA